MGARNDEVDGMRRQNTSAFHNKYDVDNDNDCVAMLSSAERRLIKFE